MHLQQVIDSRVHSQVAADQPRDESRTATWGALFAIHALLFVYGQSENQLFAAAAVASSAAVFAVRHALRRHALGGMAPLVFFIVGNVVVFGYANVGYVELTDLPRGEYHETTAWMAALLVWAACISGIAADSLLGRERLPRFNDLAMKWQSVTLGALVFAVMAAMYIASGTFSGRYEVSAQSEWIYYFQGVFWVVYIFFILLGAQMKGSLTEPRNIVIVSFVIVVAFLQGLSGGREPSLMMCAFLLLGAGLGRLPRRGLWTLGTGTVALGAIFVIAIGLVRSGREFGGQSVANRAHDVRNVAEQMSADGDDNSQVLGVFFGRAFETTAQVIIDQTIRTQRFVGSEGVEALAYVFVPRFLAPNKPVIDDANEILARDYGYAYGYTRFPLTIVADAYRRGGPIWVFFTGLVAGLVLRLSARATIASIGGDFGMVGLAMWCMICLRLYVESVWSLVSVLTYAWLKLVILLGMFSVISRTAVTLTEARGPR